MRTLAIETDIYIKDEGYAAITFLTQKARDFAHENEIENSKAEFGDEFCGQKIWKPGMTEGLYTCGLPRTRLPKMVRRFEKAGLTIESEL